MYSVFQYLFGSNSVHQHSHEDISQDWELVPDLKAESTPNLAQTTQPTFLPTLSPKSKKTQRKQLHPLLAELKDKESKYKKMEKRMLHR